MDYGFSHQGTVYTPNGTTGIAVVGNDERNQLIEAEALANWAEQPDRFVAYYAFPAEDKWLFGKPRTYRENFRPLLHSFVNQARPEDPGTADQATVSTWLGATIGTITRAVVYTGNSGAGRVVAITVRGTNGATYHGSASWDNGSVIRLRKSKG